MRRVVTFATCVGVGLLTIACAPLDRQYFQQSMGTNFHTPELPEATRLQDLYVAYICRQAGLPVTIVGDVVLCEEPAVGSAAWATFVQTGMNDLDQRCDAYLAWLDSWRRSSGPIQQPITDTRNATELIMTATGSGPIPLGVVGAAFGLAYQTFTNINSQLLTQVDNATVQALVLNRQQKYREGLPRRIDNRPAALYALRSYLRICMPFTIETEINTTIQPYERGGAAAIRNAKRNLMIDPPAVRRAAIRQTTAPLERSFRAPVRPDGVGIGDDERRLLRSQVRDLQRFACTRDDGILDVATRERVLAYLGRIGQKDPSASDRITARDLIIIREEIDDKKRAC